MGRIILISQVHDPIKGSFEFGGEYIPLEAKSNIQEQADCAAIQRPFGLKSV